MGFFLSRCPQCNCLLEVLSAIDAPLCRLCHKPHWQRAGCDFGKNTNADIGKAPQGGKRTPGRSGDSSSFRIPAQAGEKLAKNTPREGRDVLKGAKPTSTASTEKPDPQQPAQARPPWKRGIAEKPAPGMRKTARKVKRKKARKGNAK